MTTTKIPSKILLIQFKQRGDIILTVPIARKLKKTFPDSQIDFLCFPMGKPILKHISFIDNLIILNHQKGFLESLKVLNRIYREKYDIVLDYMNNPRSALFTLISRAPIRICLNSARKWIYTDIIPNNTKGLYIVEQKLLFLKPLDIQYETSDLSLHYHNSDQDLSKAMAFYKSCGIQVTAKKSQYSVSESESFELSKLKENKPIIALSPTHRRQTRRWPGDYFVSLANQLIDQYQAQIVWIWGPGEYDFVQFLHDKVSLYEKLNKTNKTNKKDKKNGKNEKNKSSFIIPPTTLNELSAFLSYCDFFIGNSNGPSHIAVANHLKTIEFHGPTNPQNWVNTKTGHHRYLVANVPCLGCGKNVCIENKQNFMQCMNTIQPQKVVKLFDQMWSDNISKKLQ